MNSKHFIPLGIFIVLVGLLYWGLGNDPKLVPSPFINKPAPQFDLPRLYADGKISPRDMQGKVWMLNVFASWCVSCRAEHELLSEFIAARKIDVIGLNYKDYRTEDYGSAVLSWLKQFGNPYTAVAVDTDGTTGINWGVYGVPETFVVDKKGIIRDKFTGPLNAQSIKERLLPLIDKLDKENAS